MRWGHGRSSSMLSTRDTTTTPVAPPLKSYTGRSSNPLNTICLTDLAVASTYCPHVLICVNSIICGSEIEPYMQFELACYSILSKFDGYYCPAKYNWQILWDLNSFCLPLCMESIADIMSVWTCLVLLNWCAECKIWILPPSCVSWEWKLKS
jgi:hypothetical protein